MNTTDSPNTSSPDDASTPPVDRWDISGLPPEPDHGAAIVDRDGDAWVRYDSASGPRDQHWTNGGKVISWAKLLTTYGPLTRLVPADDPNTRRIAELERQVRGYDADRHDMRERFLATDKRNTELLAQVDQLRNTVARYRGTPPLQEAARKVVADYDRDSGTNRELDNSVRALRRLLRDATADRDRSTSESRHNTITRHRMNVVSNARRLLDKAAEADDPSDVDLRLVLGDLRYAVDTMDKYLATSHELDNI